MIHVSVSPHIRTADSTATIMRDVAIALLPSLLFGVFVFGLPALLIILLSIGSCLLTEWAYEKIVRRPVTLADGSALVTGMILAVNLPASVPLWLPVMGGVFAMLFVKQLFGGLGQNIMNPALAARCFLIISFPALMGSNLPAVGNLFGSDMWAALGQRMTTLVPDATTAATPLVLLRSGKELDLMTAFLGIHSGCIGETCSLGILIGAAYMLCRRVITPRIPVTYLASTAVLLVVFNLAAGNGMVTGNYLLGQMVSGGLLTGAVFMATDYVTSPVTKNGQLVYGILLGFLTALFRVFGSSPEGVSYAIIISNLLVPLIEKATMPRAFGLRKAKKGGAAA